MKRTLFKYLLLTSLGALAGGLLGWLARCTGSG